MPIYQSRQIQPFLRDAMIKEEEEVTPIIEDVKQAIKQSIVQLDPTWKKLVLRLASRGTECNKRIDILLRKQSEQQDVIKELCAMIFPDSKDTDDKDDIGEETYNSREKVLYNKEHLNETHCKKYSKSIEKYGSSSKCLTCKHKVWVYETTQKHSHLRCSNIHSPHYNLTVEEDAWCDFYEASFTYGGNWDSKHETGTIKIYTYDFISKKEIEEEI